MDKAFTKDTHGILHTDMAPGFGRAMNYQLSGKKHVGIEEHYTVNHSLKEWTRQEPRVLQDWVSGETAAGTAGSQEIEKSWDLIKDELPRHLSCRTEAGIAEIDEHVRDRQWHHMISTAEVWPAFCQAATLYQQDCKRATGHMPLEGD